MKNKKVVISIISVVAVLLVIIGVTYAYWLVTRTQTNQNVISSGCLDISLTGEKNDIELQDQFPLSDEDGMKLTPYEFTVTNNCTTSVDYQINLESIGDSSNAIKASAIKVALDNNVKLLSSGNKIDPTISNAYESHSIAFGALASNGEDGATAIFKLRIWIDEDAPISEQNKTFQSKISVTIGQGIENPYKEGTLAYDILSNYGSANSISEVDETDIRHRAFAYPSENFYIGKTSNYYYGTSYIYDESTNKYKLSGTLVQAKLTECREGKKTDGTAITCGKYTLRSSSSTSTGSSMYEIIDFKETPTDINGSAKDNYVNSVNIINYTNSFGANSENESGLYKSEDDLGDSYYFRGNVTNNYVKFGTYAQNNSEYFVCYDSGGCINSVSFKTLTECEASLSFYGAGHSCKETVYASEGESMYWRIIRINGDGTIRMIYDGTAPVKNGEAHEVETSHVPFNYASSPAEMIGYTRNTSETDLTQIDSAVKEEIDLWYANNLETTYGKYIADSIFCNDRDNITANEWDIKYAAYNRLPNNPQLTCTNKTDRYTVNDNVNGNTLLTYPIGLITADEAIMAKGATYSSDNDYIYVNKEFWTMTPSYYSDPAFSFGVRKGNISNTRVGMEELYARPVINLKADVKFTGKGTIDSPYEIVME